MIEIRELRPTELSDAIAFAEAHGSTLAQPRARGTIRGAMSLLARCEGRIVGAVLHAHDGQGHRLELALSDPPDADETDEADPAGDHLARTLVDKALLKMRPGGITTARIIALGEGAAARLWSDTRWGGELGMGQ